MPYFNDELTNPSPPPDGGYSLAPLPEPHREESTLWRALGFLNRPYSATMGAVTGIMGGKEDALTGAYKGITGEKSYSVLDALDAAGFNPDDPTVKYSAMAADIVNPLDPLNYVGVGFVGKAGKAGRAINKISRGEQFAEMGTRVGAAAAGKWSPLSFMGKSLVPKAAAEAIAGPVDKAGEFITRKALTNPVMRAFGGMKKFEAAHPMLTDVIGGKVNAAVVQRDQFAKEASGVVDTLRGRGLSDAEVEEASRHLSYAMESPLSQEARTRADLEAIDTNAGSGFTDPIKTDAERQVDAKALMADQQQLMSDKQAVRAIKDDSGEQLALAGVDAPKVKQEAINADRVISDAIIDPADPAPPVMQLDRRAQLEKDLAEAQKYKAGAHPLVLGHIDLVDMMGKFRDNVQDIYQSRIGKINPEFKFPIQNYWAHIFPSDVAKKSQKAVAAAQEAERALRMKYASQGLADDVIDMKVAKELGGKRGLLSAENIFGRDVLTGANPAMKHRGYKMTLEEMSKLPAEERAKLPGFEEAAPVIMNNMGRNATRWGLGFDLHKAVVDAGYTIPGEEWRGLGAAEKRNYVKMDFDVPGLKTPTDSPFFDKYMTYDASQILKSRMNLTNAWTNRTEWTGMMEALHKARHVWVSWTLGPFPQTHFRNVVNDVSQSYLAGLNPITDFAKAATGDSSYMAAMPIATRAMHLPPGENANIANASLDKVLSGFNAKYGQNLDVDGLMGYMKQHNIIETGHLRDDLESYVDTDKVIQDKLRRSRSPLAKMGSVLDPRPDRNPIVQAGFQVGQKGQNYTRSALFIHALKEGMQFSEDHTTALQYAEGVVRKHLFDYKDLTSFEKDVMRLVFPFYSWTAKNLPLQLEKGFTDPGKMAWVNRGFQGAWAGQDEPGDLQYEDIPRWMQDNFALPVHKSVDKEGNPQWSMATLAGWIPQTELNELADAVRGEKFLGFFAERLNPAFKEYFEQQMNFDSYLGRKIDEGQTVEMFGKQMNPRVQHLIRNIRLVNEVDKLNPGDAWTKIWEGIGNANPGAGRPHRREAAQMDRWAKQLLGFNFYGVNQETEVTRVIHDAEKDAGTAKVMARVAKARGQVAEFENFKQQYQAKADEARAANQRLNQLRRDKAMKLYAKDAQ